MQNGKVRRLQHADGFINLSQNGTPVEYFYYLKDHLGNVRATLTNSSLNGLTVMQANDYYPFGMSYTPRQTGLQDSNWENKYKYNGKEEQEVPGGWLDYGFRMYDPALARWHVVDPMSEKYQSFSSYNYCINNPILYIDPDGMEVNISHMSDEEKRKYEDQIARQRATSKLFDALYSFLEESDKIVTIKFGETETIDGHQVEGQSAHNKDGSSVITFLSGQEIKTGTLSEETFHSFQNLNKDNYDNGVFNMEFEAKTFTTAVGSEGFGSAKIAGMGEFQDKVMLGEYGNNGQTFTSSSVKSETFQKEYKQAANNYAEFNKANNIGNKHYKVRTSVSPYSLQKVIKRAYE
jgi:RHS repeat-associated protein